MPTWWSTPPAAAHGHRCGWRRSGTRSRSGTRCGSGSATPPGPCLPADVLGGDIAILDAPTPRPAGRGAAGAGGRPLDRDPGRDPRRLPAHRPRRVPGLRHSLHFPDIHPGDPGRRAAGRPGPVPLPGQRPAATSAWTFPDGFLVVGDAVCASTIYGQGMSVAALETLALRRHHLRGARSARPEPRRPAPRHSPGRRRALGDRGRRRPRLPGRPGTPDREDQAGQRLPGPAPRRRRGRRPSGRRLRPGRRPGPFRPSRSCAPVSPSACSGGTWAQLVRRRNHTGCPLWPRTCYAAKRFSEANWSDEYSRYSWSRTSELRRVQHGCLNFGHRWGSASANKG